MAKGEGVDIFTGEIVPMGSAFFTSVLRPTEDYSEKLDPKPAVTIEPYMPPQIQIADMMDAGVRLAESRKARFDSVELNLQEDEDIPLDPTRQPGVDLVDVQRAAQKVSASLAASADAAKKAASEKAAAESKAADDARIEAAVQARLDALKEAK